MALASGATAVVALFLLNSLSRSVEAIEPLSVVSPFFWVDRTNAMVPGGAFDVPGVLVPLAMAVVLAAVAALLFTRRDYGAALLRRRGATRASHAPSTNPLLRYPIISTLYEQRFFLSFWLIGIIALGAYMGTLIPSVVDFFRDTPSLAEYIELIGGDNLYEAMIGYMGFLVMQLILASYAVTVVSGWAADDTEGRLEMTLSAPVSRWRVVIERAVLLTIVASALVLVFDVSVLVASATRNMGLDAANVALSSLTLVPFCLSFGAIGAAVAGRFPRAAVIVLSLVAFVSFFIILLGPLLRWPDWTMNLSAFSLVGSPVTEGISWGGMAALVAVTLVGFGFALQNIRLRDVGR